MLGNGEELRNLNITVEKLLELSAKDVREWDECFAYRSGCLHHGSIYLPPKGWGCCIPVFIHFGHCKTAEVGQQ